jgi:hypothetical protein
MNVPIHAACNAKTNPKQIPSARRFPACQAKVKPGHKTIAHLRDLGIVPNLLLVIFMVFWRFDLPHFAKSDSVDCRIGRATTLAAARRPKLTKKHPQMQQHLSFARN